MQDALPATGLKTKRAAVEAQTGKLEVLLGQEPLLHDDRDFEPFSKWLGLKVVAC